jgi:hypothetical protein
MRTIAFAGFHWSAHPDAVRRQTGRSRVDDRPHASLAKTTTPVPFDFQIIGLLGLVDRYRELAAAANDPARHAAWLRVADQVMDRVWALSKLATKSH